MGTSKDFSDTSASRYSLALYELAEESKTVDEIENHAIAMIKLISENEGFQSLINKYRIIYNVIKYCTCLWRERTFNVCSLFKIPLGKLQRTVAVSWGSVSTYVVSADGLKMSEDIIFLSYPLNII